MTVSTTASAVTIGGNGSTTVFSFDFIIPESGDEVITYTDQNGNTTVLASNLYTVSGFGNPAGGTVTYPLSGSPIPSGSTLTIARVLLLVQGTSLENQGPYLPAAVEGGLDYLTMVAQQTQAEIGLVIIAPISDPSGLDYTLPSATARANLFMGFTSNGSVTAMPGPISQTELEAALVVVFTNNPSLLPASVPSGIILDYAGGTIPTGYLLCDGSSLSTTAYPALFAAIGYQYGGSGGSFNLPSCGGNVSIGVNGTYTLGSTGGEATHTLVTGEIPSHQHTDAGHTHAITDPTHAHSGVTRIFAGGSAIATGSGWGFDTALNTNANATGVTNQTGVAAIGFTGGGGAHNNLQPYIAFNKIIKT